MFNGEKTAQSELAAGDTLLFTKTLEPLVRYIMTRSKTRKAEKALGQ